MILQYVAVQKKFTPTPALPDLNGMQNHQNLMYKILKWQQKEGEKRFKGDA